MAARYWVGGTDNWDGTAGNKWATTSGGAGGAALPVAADDVFIDNKNAPNWAASTAYTLGSIRCPLAVANGYFYEVTTAGTSAATEPIWPTVVGNTVTDGTITWTCRLATVTKTTNATCLTLNFTNFIGTWTIANGIALNVTGTGATITLGSGMTYTQGTTGVLSTRGINTAVTINFNGIVIPRLSTGVTSGAVNHAVTINGVNPTVQHFRHDSSGTGTGQTQLLGTTLNIISSLFVNTGPGGVSNSPLYGNSFNITGGGIVDVTTIGRLQTGFTVVAGTTLNMLSSLIIGGGTITFQPGSFLIHNNYTFIFNGSFAGTILDSSVVTWFNFTLNPIGATAMSISSDLNISGDLAFVALGPNYGIVGSGGTRNINVNGSCSISQFSTVVTISSTIINLNGTGVLDSVSGSRFVGTATFNINSSGYTIGSATRNYLGIENCTINLVGTNSASVLSNHNLFITGSCTLNTNNTALPGGGQIIWENLSFSNNSAVSLTNETTFTKNLTGPTAGSAVINNAKLLLGGNLTTPAGTTITGTSTIELYGSNSSNWNSAGVSAFYVNNITINKVGGTVNLFGTINYGASGRTLQRTNGIINPGTSLVSTPTSISVTINDFTFWNFTVVSSTVTQNILNTIQSNLVLSGNATFTGTAGWTTNNFTHGGANTTCTLQAGVTYTVNGIFTMIGTAAQRATLQSNDFANVTVNIGSLSNLMNVTVGTIPNPAAGYVLGSIAFSTALPPALSNIIPDRPTIASGSASPYTLVNAIGTTALTSYAGQVGKKAFFNVTNGTGSTNVIYAQTRDIDSNGGITILAVQTFADNTATPNLFRTLNWGPLIAPSGSVYYTFVS